MGVLLVVAEVRVCVRQDVSDLEAGQERDRFEMMERLWERDRLIRSQRGNGAPMQKLTLNESNFNPWLFEGAGVECVICMEAFANGQKVTALPCDIRHYFHSRCILAWSENTRNCPLCK